MTNDECARVLALSNGFGVPTLTAALVARLKMEGKEGAASKVVVLAAEIAKEYGRRDVPPDKACLRCGAYTTTTYCSRECAGR